MSYIKRLLELSGLNEDDYLDGDEEDMKDLEAQTIREKKIKNLIAMAFKRLGIGIEEIFYDEDNEREAIIVLSESEMDIMHLARLSKTGLSSKYIIGFTNADMLLQITCNISPELDQAV